jgi:hypothetical protein
MKKDVSGVPEWGGRGGSEGKGEVRDRLMGVRVAREVRRKTAAREGKWENQVAAEKVRSCCAETKQKSLFLLRVHAHVGEKTGTIKFMGILTFMLKRAIIWGRLP